MRFLRFSAPVFFAAALLSAAPVPVTQLTVGVNKSLVVDTPDDVRRIAIGNADMAEATAISAREILVNGKLVGDTSLVLWDSEGKRRIYDVRIEPNSAKLDAARAQLAVEFPGRDLSVTTQDASVFLRGMVKTLIDADRAATIAGTLGKVVNLLRVDVPPADAQILLKVRFANVDRSMSQQLGLNLFSLGKTYGTLSTGQFASPQPIAPSENKQGVTFADALNLFLFRSDINLGATIRALEANNVLQILAEPNLLTVSGRPASFLAGGEFPYPTLQGGGSGVGQITVQFREFGVRIGFLPVITPRGSIRMSVTPEVSSLDFANGLTAGGITVPGLATRRVQTEVELEDGQSFAIAGLLDNRVTETLNKIPGLANIPLFGKLFQSRSLSKNNSELLVIVTPEIVRPVSREGKVPSLTLPKRPMANIPQEAIRTPGIEVTGSLAPKQFEPVPVEQLRELPPAPVAAATLTPNAVANPILPAVGATPVNK